MTDTLRTTSKYMALREVWEPAQDPSRPGPQRSFSLEQILKAGVELLDRGGLKAFSLARLASSLKLTTNALYRYVGSREELEALLRDFALQQPSLQLTGQWQQDVRRWAEGLSLRYEAHPWLAHVPVRIPFTPNALAWLDILLQSLGKGGLDDVSSLSAAGLLDNHVRACAVATSDLAQANPTILPEQFPSLLKKRNLIFVSNLVSKGLYVDTRADAAGMLDFGIEAFVRGIEDLARSAGPNSGSSHRGKTGL